MEETHNSKVLSDSLADFSMAMEPESFKDPVPERISALGGKINIGDDQEENGLARLVLTLVRLLHELLEKQAIRRMDTGSLTDEETERLGLSLMRQTEEISRIAGEFGLDEKDLNLDLGPLGKLL